MKMDVIHETYFVCSGIQRIMELESSEPSHNFIKVDEAGFNLTKSRRCGRNAIRHRATVGLPGQQGGNITMCAAIPEHGVLTHIPLIGPFNAQHLLTFLETLDRTLIRDDERAGVHFETIYQSMW